jgi:DNA-binding MarR family transcriptional regulator/GNAT superfamily N-acetyltransferase
MVEVGQTMDDLVAGVREFNRFYTRVIGLLQEGLLRSPYTLTEVRVLFELSQRDSTEVADLRRTLDLDAGYLSRILAQLDADGLVSRQRSAGDARRQTAALTDRGRAVFADLDNRSSDQIRELLAKLTEADQRRLVGAMSAIRELLGEQPAGRDAPVGQGAPGRDAIVLRGLLPGDIGWVVQRHGALYAQEYGWDETFEAMVVRIMADYAAGHDPRREAAWIAEVDGAPVGCVTCVREDDTTARLRVLLVEPGGRGMGIGTRLVDECLRFARRAGYRSMVLLTYDALGGARRIYQRAGFQLATEEKTHAYGHDLVEQVWSRDL